MPRQSHQLQSQPSTQQHPKPSTFWPRPAVTALLHLAVLALLAACLGLGAARLDACPAEPALPAWIFHPPSFGWF